MNETELQRLQYLAALYAADACTRPELEELMTYIQQAGSDKALYALLEQDWNHTVSSEPRLPVDWDTMLDRVLQSNPIETSLPAVVPLYRRRWWAAAAVLLVLVTGMGIWISSRSSKDKATVAIVQKEIAPGHSGAVLTLADGSQVVLDSTANGNIATQANVQVIKRNGQLVYEKDQSAGAATAIAMNTLSTPRGRQYQLVLPDGTRVWLNAASSIQYPAAFSGKERRVTIMGEAYLEVAPQAHAPFIVAARGQEITVLGTSFNVNAYTDEAVVKTTLLEGSVSMQQQVLAPGQQAIVTPGSNAITVKPVDAEQFIAWKNGFWYFDHASFPELMRQLERWYDIEVTYEGVSEPNFQFGGKLERSLSLSAVLLVLEKYKIHYKLEDRHLTILP